MNQLKEEYLEYKQKILGCIQLASEFFNKYEYSHDAEMMQDVYAELREAADSMDADRLEGVFEDMKGYSVPSEDAELFVALKKAVDAYDYEKVLKLLDDNRQE